MLRSSFGYLIFAIIARMLCGNHLKEYMLTEAYSNTFREVSTFLRVKLLIYIYVSVYDLRNLRIICVCRKPVFSQPVVSQTSWVSSQTIN